ncbi:hypothetical protein L3X13_02405 [Pseudomonas stutzeri]|nr:hypothetical protein [Stutzerimonas stutzeri]MCF6803624.1 hypothetical protein [Stutzerimonas stutzeri]
MADGGERGVSRGPVLPAQWRVAVAAAVSSPLPADGLLELLRRHRWNISAAAREHGVSRPTLYRRMRLLGIRPPV